MANHQVTLDAKAMGNQVPLGANAMHAHQAPLGPKHRLPLGHIGVKAIGSHQVPLGSKVLSKPHPNETIFISLWNFRYIPVTLVTYNISCVVLQIQVLYINTKHLAFE